MANDKTLSKRWEKGQSGNPSGRPKATFFLERTLRERCCEVDPNDPLQRTHYQIIVDEMLARGKAGSVRVFNEINDRLFGKPAQAIEMNAHLTAETREANVRSILERVGVLNTVEENAKPRVN